jgi:hypothetical protein
LLPKSANVVGRDCHSSSRPSLGIDSSREVADPS